MSKLKPCPFCGGEAEYIPLSSSCGRIACVGKCGMRTARFWDEPMTASKDERTKWYEVATSAWNRRADNAEVG